MTQMRSAFFNHTRIRIFIEHLQSSGPFHVAKKHQPIPSLKIAVFLLGVFIFSTSPAGLQSIVWQQKEVLKGIKKEIFPENATFYFHNSGNDTVRIRLRCDRKGVMARVVPELTLPHSEGKIIVDIWYRGDPLEQNIPLTATSGEEEQELRIQCTFKPPFSTAPAIADVKTLFPGDTIPITVLISWNGRPTPVLRAAAVRSPRISGLTIDSLGNGYAVTMKIVPLSGYGPFSDTAIVETGCPKWPEIYLPVKGTVERLFIAQPATMNFDTISSKKRSAARVCLKSKRTKYEISRIETDPSFVLVSIARNPDRDWEVFGTIYPHSPLGPFQGEIRLFVQHSSNPELVIPLKGAIR